MRAMKTLYLALICALTLAPGQTDKPADVAGTWAITIDTGQGTATPSVPIQRAGP